MLRRFIFALSLSTALCSPLAAHAETLADTVSKALQTHPQIDQGTAAKKAADKNIHEQRAGYYPTVALQSENGRVHNNDMTTRANTASRGASSSWKSSNTVSFTQPLFTGFSVENRVDSAEARYSAATYNLTGTEEDLALRAARAHLNLMRTRELLDIATGYLSNIEQRRKNIGLMVKEGAADEAELLQADEVMVAAKNTQLGYEEAYRQAEADYREVTGAPPVKNLEFGEKNWNGILPKTLDGAVAYAIRKNARVLAADSMVAAMTKDRDAEKSILWPHVDAEVSYTKINQEYALGSFTENAQGIVRLGWNFNLGGGQRHRIDKLGEERNEAFAKRQEVVRTVEHDARQKYTSMEIVDQQFVLLTEREKAGEKILESFTAQFEGGKQSNLQLINAHSKLFESRAARVDAFYRQLLSRFELLNAMGTLREAFVGGVKPPDTTTNKG